MADKFTITEAVIEALASASEEKYPEHAKVIRDKLSSGNYHLIQDCGYPDHYSIQRLLCGSKGTGDLEWSTVVSIDNREIGVIQGTDQPVPIVWIGSPLSTLWKKKEILEKALENIDFEYVRDGSLKKELYTFNRRYLKEKLYDIQVILLQDLIDTW